MYKVIYQDNQTGSCLFCHGTGLLVIKNAYDPNLEEYITCDYCRGTGLVNGSGNFFGAGQKN